MKRLKIQEIESFDFPSDNLERKEYPWLKWLLLVVGIITVFHFVILPLL